VGFALGPGPQALVEPVLEHRCSHLLERRNAAGKLASALLKVVGAASGHAGVVKMGEDAGAALVDAASLLGAL